MVRLDAYKDKASLCPGKRKNNAESAEDHRFSEERSAGEMSESESP